MTEQEQINQNLQRQIDAQNARIDSVSTNVNNLILELKDFKDEMRQQNQMRADEIRDLRNEIRTGLDGMGKHVRSLAITSMAAIGGMAIAVGAMVMTVIYSIFK